MKRREMSQYRPHCSNRAGVAIATCAEEVLRVLLQMFEIE
jgi:hypothetical protein